MRRDGYMIAAKFKLVYEMYHVALFRSPVLDLLS